MKIRTRIAPSPTGIAHVGNIYTALINFAFAKKNKGKFILRIEDTDQKRIVKGSVEVIINSLEWLGIKHDEGPKINGPFGPYTQSKRLPLYKKFALELIEKDKAYYCFCTSQRLAEMRKTHQKQGKLPMYDRKCLTIDKSDANQRAKKERHVIRMKITKSGTVKWTDIVRGEITFENKTIDDQVLLKSDGYPTYHLAVVVDDHLMKISHVIRAEEWISSTPKHIHLYNAFGWQLPQFAHTPILRNPDRSKLSKRKNPVSIMWFKKQGFLPEALVNYLTLMGWSHPQEKEKYSLQEYIKNFSLERVKTSQPIFDIEKLKWLNGLYIREKTDKELLTLLKPFLPKKATEKKLVQIIPLVKERIHTLSEFTDYTEFFFAKPKLNIEEILKQSKHSANETKEKIKEFTKELESLPINKFTLKNIEKIGRSLVKDSWNARKFFMTIRVAITGKIISPPLIESIEILGKNETLERLKHASSKLQ